jgi:putative aldouronate transport system substrate-binding protein
MMSNDSMYYPGTLTQMFSEGYAENIYDHKELMPNYLYQAKYAYPDDTATYESVFYAEDFVPFAAFLSQNAYKYTMGYCVRQDFLDKVGMKAEDIVTWDDLETAFKAIKTEIDTVEFPMWVAGTLESTGYWQFACSFDTTSQIVSISLPPAFVKDGKVQLGCVAEGDKGLLEKLNSFYTQGLINPDWQAYIYAALFSARTYNNEVAYQTMSASSIAEANASTADPNCNWVPIMKPLQTKDQVLHIGNAGARTSAGNLAFACKNHDLELCMKWVDFHYAPNGWELFSYGPEGLVCEKVDGKWRNTDWALNNPDGIPFSGLMAVYTVGSLVEAGMAAFDVSMLNDSSEMAYYAIDAWTSWMDTHYDKAYLYPTGARLSEEQDEELGKYQGDVITYIVENYSAFIVGNKPLSEFDAYIAQANTLGLQEILAVYQECYDDYLASK